MSVGNISITLPGEVLERLERTEERFSGLRARRATARFSCDGCEKMRTIPVPWRRLLASSSTLLLKRGQ